MTIGRRNLLGSIALVPALRRRATRASAPVVRIGVLNDMSGPYRDLCAPSLPCVEQAIQDFGASVHGFSVEVSHADHRNSPEVGAAIAREWFAQGVDLIIDVPNSSVALAVASIAREKNKVFIAASAGTPDLTGRQCSPNTVQWAFDTYMLARSTAGSLMRLGGGSWFFITADYSFGHSLEIDAERIVTEGGGKVFGSIAYPFPATTDFSSLLSRARDSGAKIIGLANAGADTIRCVTEAHRQDLSDHDVRLAALLFQLTDVHKVGVQIAQGLYLTESFYWDLNARTRAFTARVRPRTPNSLPSMGPAGCYAGTLHYLRAVAAVGAAVVGESGAATVATMKAMPADDDCFGQYAIRSDGRALVPAYLFRIKSPGESKSEWDLYNVVGRTPGALAFRPLSEGECTG